MGDRITRYLPCPECGKETEQYDASSCLQWSWRCDECGWKDDRDYYEGRNSQIYLTTEKDAREKELIFDCPICKKEMTWWEKEEYKKCIMCKQDADNKQ